jgi:glycosyltransferase involved in cell wall biosynthesis
MENSNPIGIIYWGTRGGGSRFTFNLCMEMFKLDIPFVVSLSDSNENLKIFQEFFPNKIQLINCKTKLPSFVFTYMNKKFKIRKVLKDFKMLGVKNILIAMPHFLDLNVYKEANRNSMFLTRVIHDFQRHPGDVWPNYFSILLRRYSSHKLIYLSKFVEDKCSFPKKESIVVNFPDEVLSASGLNTSSDLPPCDVLVVGRIRKYKGLHVLKDVVRLLNEIKNIDFLLAGSGKTSVSEDRNLRIVERWLTESEFEAIFLKTKIVLLLHEEASQSGIPSVATANGKWIVAPNLGGIAEQISNGLNGFLYEIDSMMSLKEALFKALQMEEMGILPVKVNSELFSISLSKMKSV